MSEDNVYWNGYQWKQKLLERELREIGDVTAGKCGEADRTVVDAGASDESADQIIPIRSVVERVDGRSLADEPDRELGDETVIVRDIKSLETYLGTHSHVSGTPEPSGGVLIPITAYPHTVVFAPNREIPPLDDFDIVVPPQGSED